MAHYRHKVGKARRRWNPKRKRAVVRRKSFKTKGPRRVRAIQYARATETIRVGTTPISTGGGASTTLCTVSVDRANLSSGGTVQSVGFERLPELAKSYRFFRINKVTWQYEAPFNMFLGGSADTATIPLFMWRMDRDGAWNYANSSYRDLLMQGAKPQPFTRKKVIAYRPNVALVTNMLDSSGFIAGATPVGTPPVQQIGTRFVTRKMSPWLSTTNVLPPDDAGTTAPPTEGKFIPHFGHEYIVEAQNITGAHENVEIYCTIQVEFKDPVPLDPQL